MICIHLFGLLITIGNHLPHDGIVDVRNYWYFPKIRCGFHIAENWRPV